MKPFNKMIASVVLGIAMSARAPCCMRKPRPICW